MQRPTVRLRLWAVVISSLIVFLSGTAWAAPILDQSCCSSTNSSVGISDSLTRAQNFTVGLAGLLSSVELGTSDDLSVPVSIEIHQQIVAGTTLPLGPPLAKGTIPAGAAAFFPVDISGAGLVVTPGEVLSIVVLPAAEQGNTWFAQNPGAYAGGVAFTTTIINLAVFQALVDPLNGTPSDLSFRTFVTPRAVPGPATLTLIGLGFAAAAAWHAHRTRSRRSAKAVPDPSTLA
jgi:hypothetical protein